MADNESTKKDKAGNAQASPANAGVPLKPAGDVELTQLDSPPPSGPRSIHPRRPAPIVPEHNSETAGQSGESHKQRPDSKPE